MIYKKTYLQLSGRSLMVVVKGFINSEEYDVTTELEVLVKEPDEKDFYPPVGIGHFAYEKLLSLGKDDARQLQIIYSGITLKQMNQTLTEFEQIKRSAIFY